MSFVMYIYMCLMVLPFLPLAVFMSPLDRCHVIDVVLFVRNRIRLPSRPLWLVTLPLLLVCNQLHRRSVTCHAAVYCSLYIYWFMLEVYPLRFIVCLLSKSNSLSTPVPALQTENRALCPVFLSP